jgi:hypothetical protein
MDSADAHLVGSVYRGLGSQRCYGLSAEAGIVNDFGNTWRFRSTTRIQTGYLASHGTRRIGRNRSALSVFGLGTDWLAFGHLAIAAAFAGLWIDPARLERDE